MTRLCLACGKEKTLDRFPSVLNTCLICETCAEHASLVMQNHIRSQEEQEAQEDQE